MSDIYHEDEMTEKVKKYIQKNHMIEPKDHILIGVSGGADSVCLFFMLQNLSREMDFELSVVHVNHLIRETAGRDEEFVRSLCQKNDVLFYSEKVDVPQLAKENRLSMEEAARMARYNIFNDRAKQLAESTGKKVKLAVAHNENDQAETVLFNMFRGSSISGLRGMKPVRCNKINDNLISETSIIRPLLCLSREEIETYLRLHNHVHITDETNAQNEYSRNRIRNEILPMITESVCSKAVSHIAKTASFLSEVEDYLNKATECEYHQMVKRQQEGDLLEINAEELKQKHPYMQKAIIYKALEELAGVKKDLTSRHVESVLELMDMQVGKTVNLPYGLVAGRDYERIQLAKKKSLYSPENGDNPIMGHIEKEIELVIPGITTLPDGSRMEAKLFPFEETKIIPKKKYTKWFDYDKMKQCLVVRNRKVSDYFHIDDKHRKSIKDYMINEKIKKELRDRIYLVCDDKHVLWMPGYRISEYYKVTNETKNILELSIFGRNE